MHPYTRVQPFASRSSLSHARVTWCQQALLTHLDLVEVDAPLPAALGVHGVLPGHRPATQTRGQQEDTQAGRQTERRCIGNKSLTPFRSHQGRGGSCVWILIGGKHWHPLAVRGPTSAFLLRNAYGIVMVRRTWGSPCTRRAWAGRP